MKKFIIDVIERAIKTAAQTAIATIGTTATFGGVNWLVVVSTVGMATVLSVLMSIASRQIGDTDSASVVKGE